MMDIVQIIIAFVTVPVAIWLIFWVLFKFASWLGKLAAYMALQDTDRESLRELEKEVWELQRAGYKQDKEIADLKGTVQALEKRK